MQNSGDSGSILITVIDPEGAPLSDSHVEIQYLVLENTWTPRANSFTTDSNGMAVVSYHAQNLQNLEISASHTNFSGRKMKWNLESGDVIPATYTLKLAPAMNIGGTIVDARNNPIPGATVSLSRVWLGPDDHPDKKGEQSDFPTQKYTTGPDGRWSADSLPADLLGHIMLDIAHSNFFGTNFTVGRNPEIENQLRDKTLQIVLTAGTRARGFVLDENDRPIAGAGVAAGGRYTMQRSETRTDSQGRFDFENVKEGNVSFTVTAPGYQGVSKIVPINSSTPDIIFKLSPGRLLHGVVMNESNTPLANVHVSLDNTIVQSLTDASEFSAITDDEGKFSWNSAPAASQYFYFSKPGYELKHRVLLTPDADNVIILSAARRLEGRVLDSSTGQPIPQFTIRTGQRPTREQTTLYNTQQSRDFNNEDGRFTIQLDQGDDNAVQVWNDDHYTKIEPLPDAKNGVVEVTIRLDPADALKGTVMTADGTPVPMANVLATSGSQGIFVQMQRNSFQTYDPQAPVAVTDQQGAFSVKSPPAHGTLMVIANAGFASASIDEVRATRVVVLQEFGRIEGTLKAAGAPVPGQSLLFTMSNSGIQTDPQTYKATTDDQGHFTMEKIPPGEGSIVRMIPLAANAWTTSHNTLVTVLSGQTTQVTLGDTGAVLRGTVRFESPSTNDTPLRISGRLNAQAPPSPAFKSAAEAQSYMNSPEMRRRLTYYFFKVDANGNFQVDGIEPGTYIINVSAEPDAERVFMAQPVAQGNRRITVPENADPMNPIDVGDIWLRPAPSLNYQF